MVKTEDAIRIARSLIGTPYSELDCINLIKKVIRDAPGGDDEYTTAGTNSLWDSYNSSGKYKHLIWRQEGISDARAGMIAFKSELGDVHHAGIVTDVGTVIHSSSTQGGRGVVETPLTEKEGWDKLARHKLIAIGEINGADSQTHGQRAVVSLRNPDSVLNVRNAPRDGDVIGRIADGMPVEILRQSDGWAFVRYGDSGLGYVFASYLAAPPQEMKSFPKAVIIDGAGNRFEPVGGWTVTLAGND